MDIGTYYGMITMILVALTFIVLCLAFLYMVYGEKEETTSSPKAKFFKAISESVPVITAKFHLTF